MVIYYFLRVMALGAWLTPFPVGYWLGGLLGAVIFRGAGKVRRITLTNLGIAFPEKTEAERGRIAREAFDNMGKVAFEFFKVFHLPVARALALTDMSQAQLLVDQRGKPALIGGAHSGGWDMVGASCAALGLEVAVVVSEIRQPGLQRFVHEARSKKHIGLIYREAGVRQKCMDWMRQGKQLALTPDQNAGNRGLMIRFFNQPTSAFKGPAAYSIESGIPILPVFPYRAKDNRVVVLAGPLMDPKDYPGADGMLNMTQDFNTLLEAFMREHPGSYFWMHRRWKGTVAGA